MSPFLLLWTDIFNGRPSGLPFSFVLGKNHFSGALRRCAVLEILANPLMYQGGNKGCCAPRASHCIPIK